MLTVRSTLFTVLAHGSTLWLDFITIHMPLPPPQEGNEGAALLVAGGDETRLWVTNGTFAGCGERGAVRGVQQMSGVRSLFAGAPRAAFFETCSHAGAAQNSTPGLNRHDGGSCASPLRARPFSFV